MARKARKENEGNYFHIMVQGIGKEYVFPNDESKGYYLSCLLKNKAKYPAKILGFCVMGNHAHILLSTKGVEELSKFMQYTNAEYSTFYNRTRKRVGYVFRGRFRSEVINNERHLLYCLAYIHNNPLKAGIVEKAEEYGYSSYMNYITGRGITDFEEAAKLYDISAENIRAIMQERTEEVWIEHDDKEYEDKYEVLSELVRRYNITSARTLSINEDLARTMGLEIKERCGISLREIAELFGMGRETLRKWLSSVTSP